MQTHSNHAASTEIELELQMIAFTAPDRAQQFLKCKKNQEKSDFDKNPCFQRLRRTLLSGTHANTLQSCREHGNRAGVAIGCIHSPGSSTAIFEVQEKSRKIRF